jgi:hypothetical protein
MLAVHQEACGVDHELEPAQRQASQHVRFDMTSKQPGMRQKYLANFAYTAAELFSIFPYWLHNDCIPQWVDNEGCCPCSHP